MRHSLGQQRPVETGEALEALPRVDVPMPIAHEQQPRGRYDDERVALGMGLAEVVELDPVVSVADRQPVGVGLGRNTAGLCPGLAVISAFVFSCMITCTSG